MFSVVISSSFFFLFFFVFCKIQSDSVRHDMDAKFDHKNKSVIVCAQIQLCVIVGF